jgi:hypothetical protein
MRQTRFRFFAAAVGVLALTTALSGSAATSEAKTGGRASDLDKEYLKTAIEGDRFEIEGGKLARRTSENAIVRDLATRLVQDHSKSLEDATSEAHRLGVKIPGAPSPSQQWELEVLQTMTARHSTSGTRPSRSRTTNRTSRRRPPSGIRALIPTSWGWPVTSCQPCGGTCRCRRTPPRACEADHALGRCKHGFPSASTRQPLQAALAGPPGIRGAAIYGRSAPSNSRH